MRVAIQKGYLALLGWVKTIKDARMGLKHKPSQFS